MYVPPLLCSGSLGSAPQHFFIFLISCSEQALIIYLKAFLRLVFIAGNVFSVTFVRVV